MKTPRTRGFSGKAALRAYMIKREYPDQPVIGVAMAIFKDKRVLLIRRNKEPGKGSWSLPGGVLELGEDLLEGLKREVREELGIEVGIEGLLGVFQRIKRDEKGSVRFHYVVVDYFGYPLDTEISPGEEVQEYCWVSPEDLDRYIEDPVALNAILKAHKGLYGEARPQSG